MVGLPPRAGRQHWVCPPCRADPPGLVDLLAALALQGQVCHPPPASASPGAAALRHIQVLQRQPQSQLFPYRRNRRPAAEGDAETAGFEPGWAWTRRPLAVRRQVLGRHRKEASEWDWPVAARSRGLAPVVVTVGAAARQTSRGNRSSLRGCAEPLPRPCTPRRHRLLRLCPLQNRVRKLLPLRDRPKKGKTLQALKRPIFSWPPHLLAGLCCGR